MKKHLSLCGLYLMAIAACQGQFLLNEGDTYTYEFVSLASQGTLSGSTTSHGVFEITVGGLGLGEQFRFDVFENSVTEAPIASRIGVFQNMPLGVAGVRVDDLWQDHQGVIRVSMISGSITINSLRFQAVSPLDPNTLTVYGAVITPVPEPQVISLLTLTSILGHFIYRKRKRS